MKNYGILTRLMLSNMLSSLNPFGISYEDKKKRGRALLRTLGVLIILASGIGFVVFLEYELSTLLKPMGQLSLLLGMAVLFSMVLTLVLGLFQTLSELYQGKDAPFLAALPLTSRQVFAARMTSLYVSELGIDALITIPAMVLYCMGTGKVLPVALTGLPVLLLLPVIPLVLVTLIGSLLMRVSFFSRNRETIVMVLSMGIAIAYSVAVTMMNTSASDSPATQLVSYLMRENGLAELLISRFPPALWAMRGLIGQELWLALLAGVSVLAAALLILLVGADYLPQALSAGEHTVSQRRVKGQASWRASSAFGALHSLEWHELLRTPAWAYNALAGVIMFPLMMGIGLFAGFSKGGAGDPTALIGELSQEFGYGYIALVAAALFAMGSMVNPAVSTAISREGGRWPFALTLPVRQRTRFAAKLMVGVEINLICGLLIAVVVEYLARMPLLWLLAALALSQAIGLAASAASLWVDARRPQLKWNSEMEAIKKNFNQVFGMFLWMAFLGLCVIPAVFLWSRGGGIAMLGCAGMALLEVAVSLLLLSRVTEKHTALQD